METHSRPERARLRAHPLVALATRLNTLGIAGISGDASIEDGALCVSPMTMTTAGVSITLEGETITMRCSLPDSVIDGLPGRTLSSLVSLPSCGDEHVDDMVRRIPILEATRIERDGRSELTLLTGRVRDVDAGRAPLA